MSQAPARLAPGVYFGRSEAADGPHALLIRADSSGGARLYAPPDNPTLTPDTSPDGGDDGPVHLRSIPGLGDTYFLVTGRPEGQSFPARVQTWRAHRGSDTMLVEEAVTLRQLPAQDGLIAGVYASPGVNEESGDATGYELVLFTSVDGRESAALTALGGDFAPYLPTRLERDGAALLLEFRTARGLEHYRVTPVRGGMELRSTDEPNALPDTLLFRARWSAFLIEAGGRR